MDVAVSAPIQTFKRPDRRPVGWAVSPGLTPYVEAVEAMERRASAIAERAESELVWLLEHPPLYSAGVSAKPADLLAPTRFPVFQSGRGGQFTYHGPGQRVAYVMLESRNGPSTEAKIAAIGVKLRRWISFHGVSLNVRPDLSHFDGIVPCGISDHGVTSLDALGFRRSMSDVDAALRESFLAVFGPVSDALAPTGRPAQAPLE